MTQTVTAGAVSADDPTTPVRLVVVTAGHREASRSACLGQHLATAAVASLAAAGHDTHVTHLELRRIAVDVTRALVEGRVARPVADAVAAVRAADALVLVTPTVNASFSGLLKSFLDVLPADALRGVPTAIAATGGTRRHTLVLDQTVRPMLGYQRAIVLPSCLFVTADEWEGRRPGATLAQRIGEAGAELAHFTAATAYRGARSQSPRT